MNNQSPISAKDIFQRLISDSSMFTNSMTLDKAIAIAISLLASLVAGLLIYMIYRKFFRGVVFSQSFAVTLVGMTVLTCMITLAISTNLVLSLGMVGALSIVRYRTAIKEPMDLLFLFWAISAGITIGASMYLLVAATSFVLILLLWIFKHAKVHQVYIMIIHYKGDDIGDQIRRILQKTRFSIKSRTMRGQDNEMAVEVYAHKENLAFAEHVRNLDQVNDVTLVQYNGEYHG
jgi:hypothetical protein